MNSGPAVRQGSTEGFGSTGVSYPANRKGSAPKANAAPTKPAEPVTTTPGFGAQGGGRRRRGRKSRKARKTKRRGTRRA